MPIGDRRRSKGHLRCASRTPSCELWRRKGCGRPMHRLPRRSPSIPPAPPHAAAHRAAHVASAHARPQPAKLAASALSQAGRSRRHSPCRYSGVPPRAGPCCDSVWHPRRPSCSALSTRDRRPEQTARSSEPGPGKRIVFKMRAAIADQIVVQHQAGAGNSRAVFRRARTIAPKSPAENIRFMDTAFPFGDKPSNLRTLLPIGNGEGVFALLFPIGNGASGGRAPSARVSCLPVGPAAMAMMSSSARPALAQARIMSSTNSSTGLFGSAGRRPRRGARPRTCPCPCAWRCSPRAPSPCRRGSRCCS